LVENYFIFNEFKKNQPWLLNGGDGG